MLFSQTFYGLLFRYLYTIAVVHRMYIINQSQFLSCCTFNQLMTVNSSTNVPITKNNLHALLAYV